MTQTAPTWAIVPAKGFAAAKQRLSKHLAPECRRALAKAMLCDVLEALAQVSELDGIALVTADPSTASVGRDHGARIITEGALGGHTAAVTSAAGILMREGCAAILSIPGDVPLVSSAEVRALLSARGAAPDFVISPAHDGRGSNAILCAPPGAVPLSYGDDSFEPHLAAARREGIEPKVLRLPGIGLDIDSIADVHAFMSSPSDTHSFRLLSALREELGKPPTC